MAEGVGAAPSSVQAIGGEATVGARLGSVATSQIALATSSTYFALTPHRMIPPGAFTHWGQTDIFFGGDQMDVPYGDLD
jgi:hypothetical protein